MSEIPAELRYAASHEWARLESDGTVTVGITDHAQDALGDVVYVELPEVGARVAARDEIAVVESVKAASDIYAPIAGTVLAVNEALEDAPQTVLHAAKQQIRFAKRCRVVLMNHLRALQRIQCAQHVAECNIGKRVCVLYLQQTHGEFQFGKPTFALLQA